MVHSGFSSPMNTTSALPLPASTTVPPVVPPPADSTEQTVPQTPIKPISNSDSTNVSTPVPSNAETPINNDSESVLSTLTPTPAQPVFNGRTSGRKRTPKSCDCCGPKGHSHNVQTPNRGRGRARGRARGRGSATNLEDTPKRKLGGLLTHNKSITLINENLGKDEGTTMGADSPSQNSTEIHILVQDGVGVNSVSSDLKNTQSYKTLKDSVSNNDVEMRVLDRPVDVVQSSFVTGSTLSTTITTTTPGEIKRKIDDNVVSSSTSVQVASIANKQAKLEPEQQTDPKPSAQNGDVKLSSNGLLSSNKEVTQVTNGPLQTGTKPGDTSAVDLILIDQTSEKTNSVPLTLSNGNATTPNDYTQEVIAMDSVTPKTPTTPPPPQDPITVSSEEHPWALRDHRMYCLQGTWGKVDQTVGAGGELNDKSQGQEEEREQLLDMVHEFLESFYLKYGSFIPLAESDVVEHLKSKGKSDLTNKGLDIQKEVKQYRAGLASAPVAGFMVTHNRHTLSLEDLSTLEEQNWINDQIINMYGELIMEATDQKVHFFNSFFHKQLVAKGYEGVKRWTKKI
ncbi:mucin-2-like isoform X2 [Boleophthalmus pectinirostris]|nr:mucin-2-like isoform X2 [Boleophthalmus pectinirostris]